MPTRLITDTDHYTTVLDLAMNAKMMRWIGTTDIKLQKFIRNFMYF